jgi:hypothetical protein
MIQLETVKIGSGSPQIAISVSVVALLQSKLAAFATPPIPIESSRAGMINLIYVSIIWPLWLKTSCLIIIHKHLNLKYSQLTLFHYQYLFNLVGWLWLGSCMALTQDDCWVKAKTKVRCQWMLRQLAHKPSPLCPHKTVKYGLNAVYSARFTVPHSQSWVRPIYDTH